MCETADLICEITDIFFAVARGLKHTQEKQIEPNYLPSQKNCRVITWRRLINHAQDTASLWNVTEQKSGPLYVCLSINVLFSSFCLFLQNIVFSSMRVVPWYCAYNSLTLLKFGRFPTALMSALWNLKTLGLYILSFEVMMWFIILQLSLATRG